MMSRRNPEDVLRVLQEQALEDEMDEVAGLSDEEIARELRAAGVSLDAVHAEAGALYERLQKAPVAPAAGPPAPAASRPTPPVPLRPRSLVLLAAALAAALAAGVAAAVAIPTAVVVARSVAPPPVPPAIPSSAPAPGTPAFAAAVAEVRRKALEGCAARRWVECLYGLDVAQRDDPAGDADPAVRRARYEATVALVRGGLPREPDTKTRGW